MKPDNKTNGSKPTLVACVTCTAGHSRPCPHSMPLAYTTRDTAGCVNGRKGAQS